MRAEGFRLLMSQHRHHRRITAAPDWRRLALGVIAALLMSVQGAAALAHNHSHDEGYGLVQAGINDTAALVDFEPGKPIPGKSAPAAQCLICHSPAGAASILPVSTAGLALILSVTDAARPILHSAHPRAAPKGVWRVRGPPSSLHA